MKLIQNQARYFKQDGVFKVEQSVSIDKASHYFYFTKVRALLECALGGESSITISPDSKTIYWVDNIVTPDSRAFKFSQDDLIHIFKDCLYSEPTTVNERSIKYLVDIKA